MTAPPFDYHRRGWRTVLILPDKKGPTARGWPDHLVAPDVADRHLASGGNIGVILGRRSGDLVDADLDCQEALVLADIYLPLTGAEFGRKSKPRSHRLYIAPGVVNAPFADLLTGKMLVELRADGATGGAQQTLFPPSVADDERREWVGDTIEPAAVDARVLYRRVAYLAVGCLIRRYISPYASESPGPDMLGLLWEFDRDLARPAHRWLDTPTPDQPRRYPKPRAAQSGTERDLADIIHAIPNNCGWEEWNSIGLAIFAVDSTEHGYVVFDDFSAKSPKYDPNKTKARWRHYDRSPPSRTGLGKLAAMARKHGWRPAAQERAA